MGKGFLSLCGSLTWQGMKIFNIDLILFVFKIKRLLWMSCLSYMSLALWFSEWLEVVNQSWVMLPFLRFLCEVMEECSDFLFGNKNVLVIKQTSFWLSCWLWRCLLLEWVLWQRLCWVLGKEERSGQWNCCCWHCHFGCRSSPCFDQSLSLELPLLLLLCTF